MKHGFLFVAASLVAIAGCASDPESADGEGSAISTTCGLPPTVGACEKAVCTSEGFWEVDPRPAGTVCNGTGKCDGAGNCVVTPPPPPSCDHPPPARYLPGQNGNYPNGADILSCTRPAPGVEAWHIEYPSVDRWATDYPVIAFNAGDSVTVNASGCAQTGGHGATWKRYVNPENDDGHESGKYYGTLSIWGVTGGEQQPLQHWIGPAFEVPTAPAHLALGFTDDGYSDNGYWGHDDGDLGQCASSSKATVDVVIDHNPRPVLTCAQWESGSLVTATAGVPELAQIASLLRTHAEVPIGVPVTPDASAAGITHFQIFQDGGSAQQNVVFSNAPINSTELHSDGCMYVAYTPTTAPEWYPIDLAFDSDPNKGWLARPWDPGVGILPPPKTFGSLQTNNRNPGLWGATNIPGTCAGCGTSWRTSAPRWIMACNTQHLPPSQWTGFNLAGFPQAQPESSKLSHSGAICDWQIKHEPSLTDSCIDSGRAEWTSVYGTHAFASAEGVVTNSFLSGGDYSGDHNDMPSGHFVGVHSDPLTHTDVDNCPDLATASSGEHCADWEINLLPDANYRGMLAADESQSGDGLGASCKTNFANEYRRGNQVADLKGALGIEGEQWYYPLGFRPEPGDRAVARGAYIVDCGHPDWHTELHPASFLQSSFLQTSDYSPAAGATWNRPLHLTSNWRAITAGNPAVVTKVILSPVHAEGIITAEIWPPARPCANARLAIAREYQTHPAWKGVTVLSEEMLPADNPNHMRITFQRSPYVLQWGGDGDVQNPDSNLTYFNAYMAWWDTHGVVCPSAGGPGSGACVPNKGAACGSCSGVVQCNGSCSIPDPPNLNASCGACGGHVQCDSSCSVATPPGTGSPCGSCGGTLMCNGSCSVPTPSNLNASCGKCGGQILCNGSCSIPTPWNLGAACGNGGHIVCGGTCQVYAP